MKRTIILSCLILLFGQISFGQKKDVLEKEEVMQPTLWLDVCDFKNSTPFKLDSISFGEIPNDLDYRGIIVEAIKWVDSSGINILLLTQTGAFNIKNGSDIDAKSEIYAFHFTKHKSDKAFSRQWKLYDFVTCPGVDMYAGFYHHSLTITDLDKNGFAEITFIYKLSCRGGVTPAPQKLILYEKNEKFAMRGETLIQSGDPKVSKDNNYKADENLKTKKGFYEFAKKRWGTIGLDDYKQFR